MLDNEVSPDTTETTTERTEADLDSIADRVDNGPSLPSNSHERPMREEPSTPPSKTASNSGEVFEFVHNGKQVKGTKDQIIKWAQQGYDYPQRAQKLNQERLRWDQDKQTWEQKWGVYKQIDDFAAKNKDWWDFIQQSWQNRGTQQQPPQQQPGTPTSPELQPYLSKIQSLEEKLTQFEPLVNQILQRDQIAQRKEEDLKLDQEVQSSKTQYKDLDWESLDENGKSLEFRIMEHAQSIGTPSFRVSLRDLLHDELMTRSETKAKLDVSRGIQQKTKLGVLGQTPTPQKGLPQNQRNKNIRETSYEDIMDEIRSELRSGVS